MVNTAPVRDIIKTLLQSMNNLFAIKVRPKNCIERAVMLVASLC